VLSRGIVGDLSGRLVVASPLYKQHFDLQTGACLEEEGVQVEVYSVRLDGDDVLLAA
jgi:nitrite reductase (NADH) small subunit